jgi:hypothetical protein
MMKVDLVGQRFGRLVVLAEAERLNGNVHWLCECDCEKKTRTVVNGSSLRRGLTQSCGCLQRDRASARWDASRIDLVGQRFGHLLVLEMASERTKKGLVCWLCRCDCGETKIVVGRDLRSVHVQSCGCLKGYITHGLSYHELYVVWASMIQRCENPNHDSYPRYGGSGVTVCERWRRSFLNFLIDMGERPSPQHTLDRYPNRKGNYEPGNVRWATWKQQNQKARRGLSVYQFRGKYIARICADGRTYNLGTFSLFDDALAARKVAEQELRPGDYYGR